MMKNKKLGIYIHIPFCARKCNYCDFLSAPETRETKERYLSLLDREMRLYKEIVSAREADTLFIGGGTPSFLETDLTDKLLCSVKKWIPSENLKEFTIECNPNSVTEEKLNLYKEAGVTRISLGMQSACDEELKKLGRLHSVKEFEKTYELVRKHGFERVNIDVMAAIPGQTIESYKHNWNMLLDFPRSIFRLTALLLKREHLFMKNTGKILRWMRTQTGRCTILRKRSWGGMGITGMKYPIMPKKDRNVSTI